MIMQTIRELLAGADKNAPPSLQQIDAAIDQATEDLEAARTRIASLEQERADVLLYADDKTVASYEKRLAEARLEIERLEAALPRLQQRREERHAEIELEQAHARVAKARELYEEGERLIDEATALQAKLVPVYQRMEAIDRELSMIRDSVGQSLRSQVPLSPNYAKRPSNTPLYAHAVIPPATKGAPYYGRTAPMWNNPPRPAVEPTYTIEPGEIGARRVANASESVNLPG